MDGLAAFEDAAQTWGRCKLQPWKCTADQPLLESIKHLSALYDEGEHALPVGTDLSLGRVWRKRLSREMN